jgi:uncharacterized protein (TIGR00730 family)
MRLCVFCGSKSGKNPIYAETSMAVGRVLAERRIGLVYGGGHVGLMGVIADTVLQRGGEVIGVIPRSMVESELAHQRCTELHVVDSMHDRKFLMAEKADAFLAIPGGFGTAEEFFEVVTWRQLKLHNKPIGLLNVAGYFDPWLAWMEHAFAEEFISARNRGLVTVETDATAIVKKLNTEIVQKLIAGLPPE